MTYKIQPGFAIWLTGLPASGKTTLAQALRPILLDHGLGPIQLLDSDELRPHLTPNPSYSQQERDWFYDLIILLAELLTNNGVNVLVAATASRQAYRLAARRRLKRYAEVYVDCKPEICRARDPKGLWRRADQGEITHLPGVGEPYELSESPDVYVNTGEVSVERAVEHIVQALTAEAFFQTGR